LLEPITFTAAAAVVGKAGSEVLQRLAKLEYRYALGGMILGGIIALAGIAMLFTGVTGAVDLTFHAGSNELKVNTAVVGVVIVALGVLIAFLTRPKIKITEDDGTSAKAAADNNAAGTPARKEQSATGHD
jgi:hypothetical protein